MSGLVSLYDQKHMPRALATEAVPLVWDDDRVIRIEGTRVPLETLVETFQEGATPEEIAQKYPSVSLAVIYQVIGYYLQHRTDLDDYVKARTIQREARKVLNESRWPADGIRERLLAGRK